jgi:hypothetical protein
MATMLTRCYRMQCTESVDECASEPCLHGACTDGKITPVFLHYTDVHGIRNSVRDLKYSLLVGKRTQVQYPPATLTRSAQLQAWPPICANASTASRGSTARRIWTSVPVPLAEMVPSATSRVRHEPVLYNTLLGVHTCVIDRYTVSL